MDNLQNSKYQHRHWRKGLMATGTEINQANPGIGTTGPGSRLEVENTGSADDVLLLEDSSGLCEAQPTTTGLTWSCSSDIRLKENISISTFSSLDYLGDIPLFDYNVKKTGERAMGVIAQKLNSTHPELVSVGDDGLLIASTPTAWQLVKAIQELKAENDNLKEENSKLKEKDERISADIEFLKQKVQKLKKSANGGKP